MYAVGISIVKALLDGAEDTFLDEVILDDQGGKMYVCSDSHYCARRRAEGHEGKLSESAAKAYAAAIGADEDGAAEEKGA